MAFHAQALGWTSDVRYPDYSPLAVCPRDSGAPCLLAHLTAVRRWFQYCVGRTAQMLVEQGHTQCHLEVLTTSSTQTVTQPQGRRAGQGRQGWRCGLTDWKMSSKAEDVRGLLKLRMAQIARPKLGKWINCLFIRVGRLVISQSDMTERENWSRHDTTCPTNPCKIHCVKRSSAAWKTMDTCTWISGLKQ